MLKGGKVMLGMSLLLQKSNFLGKEHNGFLHRKKGTLVFHI